MPNTFLCKEEVRVDFTVLEVGDHVQFCEPHRTFGDKVAAKVDTVKSRLYDNLSGRIMCTLVFQHHAELVNIVGDNDGRPEDS